jgi:hypothetical protein
MLGILFSEGGEFSAMRMHYFFAAVVLVFGLVYATSAQDLNTIRDDQIDRLKEYVVAAIQPSGLVRDSLVLNGSSFHPATPDAAGFALLGLSALDQLGKLLDAEQRVVDVLSAYAGQTPGVVPDRSTDGHFIHFMNIATGADEPGWDDSYSPIGSALLVAGAQFARNHFSQNATIASLTDNLTTSIDFNAAIHPSLDGRIYLDMTKAGGGAGGAVSPWNEYMLVESLALRQPNNDRALAVKDLWLDTDNLPKKVYQGIPTLTDNPGAYAPAFWVQQMHFFNGDFRHGTDFETFFNNQQQADQLYSSVVLGESYRYGLTAGLVPNPTVYHADRIGDHPFDVFSPEAVAAWGDMDTFLDYVASQDPTSNPSYRYGLVRESADQPSWIPFDAGLVDHLFLLFGLVESIDADFFADRVFPKFVPGDFDHDGVVDGIDFLIWQRGFGDPYNATDLADWQANFGGAAGSPLSSAATVPEPASIAMLLMVFVVLALGHCGLARIFHKHSATSPNSTASAALNDNLGVLKYGQYVPHTNHRLPCSHSTLRPLATKFMKYPG